MNDITEAQEVEEFLKQAETTIEKATEENFSDILKRVPKVEVATRRERAEFEARLMDQWKYGFDYFDTILDLAMQVGAQRFDLARELLGGDPVLQVLVANHGRACLVAGEVRALLAAGYPSGAHARWRSLHEIAVISTFVKKRGADVAQRYIEHGSVERAKAAVEYQRYAERLNHEPFSESDLEEILSKREIVTSKYGKEFSCPQGWALSELGKKSVTFKDIEEATGLDHMRPYYRMASSDSVHSTFKGATYNMGLIDRTHIQVLTGASNYGLTDPAHGALISLHQCTAVLLPEFDGEHLEEWIRMVVTTKVMQRLLKPAGEAFLRVQKEIAPNAES